MKKSTTWKLAGLKISVGLLLLLYLLSCSDRAKNVAAARDSILVQIDLTNIIDDKVQIIIAPMKPLADTVIYRLPKVIQGTYRNSSFGQYVENFRALDLNGEELQTKKPDTNSWIIYEANRLDKIAYWVNDTDDVQKAVSGTIIPYTSFGTKIDPNYVLLNFHGFVGYFESQQNKPYELSITSPVNFSVSSPLRNSKMTFSEDSSNTTRHYKASRYFDVTDNPMMVGEMEVAEFIIGDMEIGLGVYSPNKIHSMEKIKETIAGLMNAQKEYLENFNTTSRYTILVCFSDKKGMPDAEAIEHHTSTVVVLREDINENDLAEYMSYIIAHEFFHIITPLDVHSEDIHNFDYYKPEFSKHLWMYEGATEYFSKVFQVSENLVSPDEFYQMIENKIKGSYKYNDSMSFTVMSERILEEPYQSNYPNVYQKGPLIAMCLDILLREESEGENGLLELMNDLAVKYGKERAFDDDNLINEIGQMTYPSVSEFLEKHVEGSKPINYNFYLNKVGLSLNNAQIGEIKTSTESQILTRESWLNQESNKSNGL